jgi:hypothetical protein
MASAEPAAPDRLREAIRAHVLGHPPDPEAAALARAIADLGGGAVTAVVFFGSRKTRARPDAWSAYDLFVVPSEYGPFYDALGRAGRLQRPRLARALNSWLPPNQIAFTAPGAGGAPMRAKCAVVKLPSFLRATSERRKDHFVAGRLFQPTEILHAATPEDAERVLDALTAAHRITYAWVRTWLPPTFGVEEYCRTLLRVSFAGEIRPEPEGRTDALWHAQEPYLRSVYAILLDELAATGELVPAGPDRYAVAHPPHEPERLRMHAYFGWSLVRATVRWAKYVVTFDDWLEFIVRKAHRHSGQEIVLSERERRMPLVFLWPRVFQYLRHKNR